MSISAGQQKLQANATQAYRKQRQCQPLCCPRSHTPLVLPSLNNVLPAMVLQNRVNIKRLSHTSSVRRVSLSPAPTVPAGLRRRVVVVVVVVLLVLLMSGDIETNPGPVGKWLF